MSTVFTASTLVSPPQLSHLISVTSSPIEWSERVDLNHRSPAPRAGALPLRYAQLNGASVGSRTRSGLRSGIYGVYKAPHAAAHLGSPKTKKPLSGCPPPVVSCFKASGGGLGYASSWFCRRGNSDRVTNDGLGIDCYVVNVTAHLRSLKLVAGEGFEPSTSRL